MIQEINDREVWNEFLLSQPTQAGIFLQSWEWGEFQKAVGRKVYRLVTSLQSTVHSFAQVIELPLPLGKKYWYIPRGTLIPGLAEEAHKHSALFIRFEPITSYELLVTSYAQTQPVSPPQTLLIDLTKSEDELLAAMHEKTRYNIRLAQRKGVTICTNTPYHKMSDRTFCDRTLELEQFWKLLQETAKRDGFRTHEREYYETMLRVLHNSPPPPLTLRGGVNNNPPLSAKGGSASGGKIRGGGGGVMSTCLWMAYHENTPLAAAIVAYFGDTATYLHGASSYEHRALMGPYALHWEIMRDAKAAGYKYYDFWGINIRSTLHAPRSTNWSGLTRFKLGFGGTVVTYPGTLDLPLNKFWYTLYRFGRKIL